MNRKNYFQAYESRLQLECILKSSICGLITGAAMAFVAAFITWFFPHFNGLWLSIGLLVLGTAAATPIFYSTLFKPTVMGNARRLDRLGLDERLVTMVEYEKDDSYIAQCQREDAKRQLNKIDVKSIKFDIPKKIIIAVSICAFLGVGMTTVTGLSNFGILPSGGEFIDNLIPDPPPEYREVNYIAMDGGAISGDDCQIVELGSGTMQVVAVPDDGYMFYQWDDGSKNPVRFDANVQENLSFVAVFMPLGDSGDGGDGDSGDQPGDQPGGQDGKNPNPGPPNTSNSPYGGGKYETQNQIIDGNTYYKDEGVFDVYRDSAMEQLSGMTNLSAEQRAILEAYFKIIA